MNTIIVNVHSYKILTTTLLIFLGTTAISCFIKPAAADIVQARYAIAASGFLNSNNDGPSPPTSTQISGVVTFSYDTNIVQQFEIVPDVLTGFDMTDNDGDAVDYSEANTGVNVFVPSSVPTDHQFTVGGTVSSVAFMVGISEDFRIRFDVSPIDYTVTNIRENYVFITTADAFYTAQNTSVILEDVLVLPDSDGDGIVDTSDNCLLAVNAGQRDGDSDGIGNACDPDFNQDCIVNFADVAQFAANFLQPGNLVTDLNGDSVTNFADFSILTPFMFGPPGPTGVANSCGL